MRPVTSNAVAGALGNYSPKIKIKVKQVMLKNQNWNNYANGGYYINLPVSDFITDYTTLISVSTNYWTGFSWYGFYLGFDNDGTNITIALENIATMDNAAYVNVRLAYI